MAVTATPYGQFCRNLGAAVHNFSSDILKVLLATSAYTPNIDTDQYANTPAAHEASGAGYTSSGQQLTSVTWAYDAANNWALLTAASVTFTAATFTCRYAVIYKSAGTMASSPLIGYIDFGVDKSPATEDFILNFTNGVVRVKVG